MTVGVFLLYIAALAVATLIGYFAVALFWPPELSQGPAWAFAPGVGGGLCSLIFFVFRRPMFTVEFVLLLALFGVWLYRRGLRFPKMSRATSWRLPAVWLLLAATLGMILTGLIIRVYAAPHGDWDSFAIWNSHSRYLYRAGPTWEQGIQNTFHPGYPLLTPSLTAREWRYASQEEPEAASIVGLLLALSAVAVLATSLAELRDPVLATLTSLVLVSTPFYMEYGVSGSADVPLSLYVLSTAALLCLYSERARGSRGLLVLAGFTAGCAGWTKNEGSLFIVAVCAALLFPITLKPRLTLSRFGPFFLGLLVPLAVLLFFKLTIALPDDLTRNRQYAELVEKALDSGRYVTILQTVSTTFWSFGYWIIPPAIPLLLFIALRGGIGDALRSFGWLTSAGIVALQASGYFAVYVLTPMELQWHLDTSLSRLYLHLWPVSLLVAGLAARVRLPAPSPENS